MKYVLPRASYSRLSVYKLCPNQYKLKYIDKITEPDRPVQLDRAGNPKSSAAERGSFIHDSMDNYINDRDAQGKKTKIPPPILPELLNIKMEVDALRELMRNHPETTYTEQKWYFDMEWNELFPPKLKPKPGNSIPTKGKYISVDLDYGLVAIIDCMVIDDRTDPDYITARIIDLKSGKSYNNQSKHAAQLNLYAATAARKFPDIQEFSLELLYCDEGKHTVRVVDRNQALAYGNYWQHEIEIMHVDNYYDPSATSSNCRFCCRRPITHGNKWVNGDGTCPDFIEHPNDKIYRQEQAIKKGEIFIE